MPVRARRDAGRRALAWVKFTLLSLTSAFFLIPYFPNIDLDFLAWIALVPLLIPLKGHGLKAAYGLAFLTGISFQIVYFYWMNLADGFNMRYRRRTVTGQ